MSEYRLRRIDDRNCAIEMAHTSNRGKNKGKLIWRYHGLYPTLKSAAVHLLNLSVLSIEQEQETREIINAIDAAEESVIKEVRNAA